MSIDLDDSCRLQYCTDQPLLWRAPGTVQFGDRDHRLVVERISADDVRWLTGLNGLRVWTDVRGELTANHPGRRRLLTAAIAAGAIDDVGQVPDAWRLLPPEQRIARTGDLVTTRHTYRDPARSRTAMQRRLELRIAVTGTGVLYRAFREIAQSSGVHCGKSDGDITVFAGGFHPDAIIEHSAVREAWVQNRPHLSITAFGDRGVIGPLVEPGRTSCLTCHHLHMRDADPAWPLLAAQRAGLAHNLQTWPIDTAHAYLIAAHAVLLIRTWHENPNLPHLWSQLALCVWLPDGSVDALARPLHPNCGCTWSPLSADPTQG
jgi:bacteriocin biosynthesis cyclodehydratase domain-containing protein